MKNILQDFTFNFILELKLNCMDITQYNNIYVHMAIENENFERSSQKVT